MLQRVVYSSAVATKSTAVREADLSLCRPLDEYPAALAVAFPLANATASAELHSTLPGHGITGHGSAVANLNSRGGTPPSPLPKGTGLLSGNCVELEYCLLDSAHEYLLEMIPQEHKSLVHGLRGSVHLDGGVHAQAERSGTFNKIENSRRLYRLNQASLQPEYAGDLVDGHLQKRGPVQELFTELATVLQQRQETFAALLSRIDPHGRGLVRRFAHLQSVLLFPSFPNLP